jgi:hypothetical protein
VMSCRARIIPAASADSLRQGTDRPLRVTDSRISQGATMTSSTRSPAGRSTGRPNERAQVCAAGSEGSHAPWSEIRWPGFRSEATKTLSRVGGRYTAEEGVWGLEWP